MAAGNIVEGKIVITAPGVKETFAGVGNEAKKTEAVVKQLNPAISKLGQTLNQLKFAVLDRKEELIHTTDIVRAKVLNAEIKQLETEIKRVQSAGTGGLASSLGGVGKAATGALSSLRNIAYILPGIGVAGILGGLVDGLVSVFTAADDANDKIKELIVSTSAVGAAAGAGTEGDAAKVRALASIVQDQTRSYQERNNALLQLKEINKSYFGDLSLEADKLGILKARVNEYTQAIIQQAIIKQYAENIGKVNVAMTEQVAKAAKAGAELQKYNREIAANGGRTDALTLTTVQALNEKFTSESTTYSKLAGQLNEYTQALNKAVLASTQLRTLDSTGGGGTAKLDKTIDDTISKAKELAQFLNATTIREFNFRVNPADSKQDTFKRAVDFINRALDPLQRTTFEVKPQVQIAPAVLVKPGFVRVLQEIPVLTLKTFEEVKEDTEKLIADYTKRNPILAAFNLNVKQSQARAKEFAEKLAAPFKDLGKNIASTAFEGLGDAIADGLTGKGALKSVVGTISDLISQIGKALIQYGIVKTGLDKILKNPLIPGGVAIALGVAAIAASKILKNIDGFRADGGPVKQGGSYIVGERGPELFVPNSGGRIIPNNLLSSTPRAIQAASSGATGGRVIFEIQGNTLIGVLANAGAAQRRLT